jgi:hypothetical protein
MEFISLFARIREAWFLARMVDQVKIDIVGSDGVSEREAW